MSKKKMGKRMFLVSAWVMAESLIREKKTSFVYILSCKNYKISLIIIYLEYRKIRLKLITGCFTLSSDLPINIRSYA
jgi:hypothetical protein